MSIEISHISSVRGPMWLVAAILGRTALDLGSRPFRPGMENAWRFQGRVIQARRASGIGHFCLHSIDQDQDCGPALQGRLGERVQACATEDKETGYGKHSRFCPSSQEFFEHLLCAQWPGWQALPRVRGRGRKLCFIYWFFWFPLTDSPYALKWPPGSIWWLGIWKSVLSLLFLDSLCQIVFFISRQAWHRVGALSFFSEHVNTQLT